MPVDRLINILVTITLIEMMVLIGLRATFAELVQTARNLPLVARVVAANYLFVPGVAVGLLILFDTAPTVAAGFLVLAALPWSAIWPAICWHCSGKRACGGRLDGVLGGIIGTDIK